MSFRTGAGSIAIAVLVAACSNSAGSPSAVVTASPVASAAVGATPTIKSSEAPAGPWIAYMTGGISHVRADGTNASELLRQGAAPDPGHPDLAPDGRLAFQGGQDGSWDIWVADADGGNPRILVDCTSPCINMDAPAWSPDGTTIAFSRLDEIGDQLPSMLQLVDVASGAVATVAETPSGEYVTGPRWSPDGRRLVVTYEDHRGPNGTTVEIPVASRIAVTTLADAKPTFVFLAEAGMEATYPDWHPTQDLIVFQVGPTLWDSIGESRSNLFTIHADGSDFKQLTTLGPDDRVIWMPTWAADGDSILATLTVRATRENTIARLSADGSVLADLPGPVSGAHPRQQRVSP